MKVREIFRGWKEVEEHPAGAVIFSPQEPAEVMYVVLSGEVELSLHGEPLGVEKEGGLLGEMAMIASTTRMATARAVTDSRLARLDARRFEQIVRSNPEFSMHVMGVLANRLRAVDRFISARFENPE